MAPEYIGAIVCLMFVGLGVLIGYIIWGLETFHKTQEDDEDVENN